MLERRGDTKNGTDVWNKSLHDGGLVKEVVLGGPNAYRRIVFEKNGEFEPCNFAMASTSATGIFRSKGPFQSVKPVRDRFPKVDVDWPLDKFTTVSRACEKLHWFEGGLLRPPSRPGSWFVGCQLKFG